MEFASYSILSVLKRTTYHSRMIPTVTDHVPESSMCGVRLYIHLINNLDFMNDHKNDEMKSVNRDQEFTARFGMITQFKTQGKKVWTKPTHCKRYFSFNCSLAAYSFIH